MSLFSVNKKAIWTNLIEPIILGITLVLWICSMILQFQKSLVNYEFAIFMHYGQISITLFGITLLGGIFENIKQENHRYEDILLRLFDVSLNFLLASIWFFYLYSLTFWASQSPEPILVILIVFSILIAMIIGAGNTIFGLIKLYLILRNFRNQLFFKKSIHNK